MIILRLIETFLFYFIFVKFLSINICESGKNVRVKIMDFKIFLWRTLNIER